VGSVGVDDGGVVVVQGGSIGGILGGLAVVVVGVFDELLNCGGAGIVGTTAESVVALLLGSLEDAVGDGEDGADAVEGGGKLLELESDGHFAAVHQDVNEGVTNLGD